MNDSVQQASSITAPTRILEVNGQQYAYRRFGNGQGRPLLFLQHFSGTLDNWDPAVTDPLAVGREVILVDNAGVGRSTGEVPTTVDGMTKHVLAFLEGLGIKVCDVLGFSLGGMIAQQLAQARPELVGKMILVGTAPRGGEDIMHLEKPSLAGHLQNPKYRGYEVLQKIFFTDSAPGQAAGADFIGRLMQRKGDRDTLPGPMVAGAQIAAFRDWERVVGERFGELSSIRQPTLVVQGVRDEMIPVRNSYWLGEHLPNAVLLTYPDAGHGSLFQYHQSFVKHAGDFLVSDSEWPAY